MRRCNRSGVEMKKLAVSIAKYTEPGGNITLIAETDGDEAND